MSSFLAVHHYFRPELLFIIMLFSFVKPVDQVEQNGKRILKETGDKTKRFKIRVKRSLVAMYSLIKKKKKKCFWNIKACSHILVDNKIK